MSDANALMLPFGDEIKNITKPKRKSGAYLPSDWEPSNGAREYGHTILHLTDEQINSMAEDMRLWAGANSNRAVARKADWGLAFKSWMRREAAKTKPSLSGKKPNSFYAEAMGIRNGR